MVTSIEISSKIILGINDKNIEKIIEAVRDIESLPTMSDFVVIAIVRSCFECLMVYGDDKNYAKEVLTALMECSRIESSENISEYIDLVWDKNIIKDHSVFISLQDCLSICESNVPTLYKKDFMIKTLGMLIQNRYDIRENMPYIRKYTEQIQEFNRLSGLE